jgi:Fe-S cluster assembly ATPase SufC
MDWTQSFAIMGVFIAAFLYMMSRMDANQKQNNDKFDGVNKKFESMNERLTTLEVEMRTEMRNVNQRLSTIEGYLVPRKVFHFEDPKEEPKEN